MPGQWNKCQRRGQMSLPSESIELLVLRFVVLGHWDEKGFCYLSTMWFALTTARSRTEGQSGLLHHWPRTHLLSDPYLNLPMFCSVSQGMAPASCSPQLFPSFCFCWWDSWCIRGHREKIMVFLLHFWLRQQPQQGLYLLVVSSAHRGSSSHRETPTLGCGNMASPSGPPA